MRKWLVEIRNNNNLTQDELAENVGITRQMISAIELGKTDPSVTVAKAIAAFLEFEWQRFYESDQLDSTA